MAKQLLRLCIVFLVSMHPLFAKESIRITNGEWPPYLSHSLPHQGFVSHVVTEAFNAVDIEVEYGFFPWKRALKYAKQGYGVNKEDIWHASVVWVYTPERAEDFLYSDVVVLDDEVLFYLKSAPVVWESVDDLKDKIIGATAHTVYPLFEAAQEKGLLHIQRAGNYDTLYKRLILQRIDAVPQVRHVGSYFLRTTLTQKERDLITFYPTIIDTRKYHLIFSKAHPENERLLFLFNQGLQKIKASGKYDAMMESLERGHYDTPAP